MKPCLVHLLAGCAVSVLLSGPATAEGERAMIGGLADSIDQGAVTEVGGATILASQFINRFYDLRDGQAAWFGTPAAPELLAEITLALGEGFLPSDFHMRLLAELHDRAASGNARDIAEFEIVASDAAARLVHHTLFGKVDPAALDPDWNFDRPVIERNPAEVFNEYLAGAGFSALMERLAIGNTQYRQLVDALHLYQEIAARGGWPMIADGAPLKPGTEDARIPMLRERLATEGDYADTGATGNLYDDTLAEAVAAFQKRHGLTQDGVIGPRTLAALNHTAEQRADQLRLSLERFRWYVRDMEDDYVLVNIGGARTSVVFNDELVWTTRSITGSAYRQTPVFQDEIEYMVFNPTWSVPASIFRKDKLPRIRKDSGYLEKGNYVVRNSSGDVIPASSVNWGAENPGVSLMQKPGPDNALGRVKFMFPNDHAVYLHDTNDRGLFDRDERNLSSGCVRVQDPFVLAGLLMQDDPDWTQDKMQSILDSGETTRIDLPEPVPVMLTYWTAWVEFGEIHFRDDLYDRDPPVLRALNAEM